MNDVVEQQIVDIDMRGQVCPACLLVAMDKMNKNRDALKSGAIKLCIQTDNREATTTIPTTAKNMGYDVKVTKKESFYQICVGILSQENKS